MAEYYDKKDTHLKWHRLRQFILMPVTILANIYALACFITEYFNIGISGVMNILHIFLNKIELDLHVSGPLHTVFICIFGAIAVLFVFEFIAWIKSFRWKKSSLVFHLLFLLAFLAGTCVIVYFLIAQKYIDTLATQISLWTNKRFTTTTLTIFVCAVAALLALYVVLNLVYDIKRRRLYGKKKKIEEDEYVPVQEPAVSTVIETSEPEDLEQTAAILGLKFCTNCGTRLTKEDLDMTYCKYCGKKFEKK